MAASGSSLSSVVSKLTRASFGASASSVQDEDLDRYVREMIMKEAKQSEDKYKGQEGFKAYLPTPEVNIPKTNKRFLHSIIRNVDDHNTAVLREQAKAAEEAREQREEQERAESRARATEAAQERMRRLMGGGMRRNRDGRDRDAPRPSSSTSTPSSSGRERTSARDGRDWRRRDDYDDDYNNDERYSRSREDERRGRDPERRRYDTRVDQEPRSSRRHSPDHPKGSVHSDRRTNRHRSLSPDDESAQPQGANPARHILPSSPIRSPHSQSRSHTQDANPRESNTLINSHNSPSSTPSGVKNNDRGRSSSPTPGPQPSNAAKESVPQPSRKRPHSPSPSPPRDEPTEYRRSRRGEGEREPRSRSRSRSPPATTSSKKRTENDRDYSHRSSRRSRRDDYYADDDDGVGSDIRRSSRRDRHRSRSRDRADRHKDRERERGRDGADSDDDGDNDNSHSHSHSHRRSRSHRSGGENERHQHKRSKQASSSSLRPGPDADTDTVVLSRPGHSSKMDKYFDPAYDPGLDYDTTAVMDTNALVGEGAFDQWNLMLQVVRLRREEKEDRKRKEKEKAAGGSKAAASSSGNGEVGLMDLVYKKRGAVREWDLGKD
ncbi:hypothetical protein DL93DRAFT_2162195 [Clavulina sp. PMI_390]|nr:hypothetical protein DL93DRAFT_2162195 [Clavulina sp. PMI_390]